MGRRGFGPKSVLALLVLAFLFVVAAGCGLFEPRDPRPAVTLPERCRVRLFPDSVLTNIVLHYGRGTTCYADQVDTAFLFSADPQDSLDRNNQPTNPFVGWNRDVEIRVSQDISSSVDSIRVFFDSTYATTSTTTNPTRETRYYYYHLLVFQGSSVPARYQGQAEMTFLQRTTDYTLEAFRDHRDGSGLPTWGSLRADRR